MCEVSVISTDRKLLAAGCEVHAYDPVAVEETKRRIGDLIHCAKDIYDAVVDADALMLVTNGKEFRFAFLVCRKEADGYPKVLIRNIYDIKEMEGNGFVYHCIEAEYI